MVLHFGGQDVPHPMGTNATTRRSAAAMLRGTRPPIFIAKSWKFLIALALVRSYDRVAPSFGRSRGLLPCNLTRWRLLRSSWRTPCISGRRALSVQVGSGASACGLLALSAMTPFSTKPRTGQSIHQNQGGSGSQCGGCRADRTSTWGKAVPALAARWGGRLIDLRPSACK